METLAKVVFTAYGIIMYILINYFGLQIETSNGEQLFLAVNIFAMGVSGLYWWACYSIVDSKWGY